MKRSLHPESERHLGVGVMPADHEDDRVHEDEPVRERREWKALCGQDEHWHGDEDRKDLHHPRSRLRCSDSRDDQQRKADDQENRGFTRAHGRRKYELDGASSTRWLLGYSATRILGW